MEKLKNLSAQKVAVMATIVEIIGFLIAANSGDIQILGDMGICVLLIGILMAVVSYFLCGVKQLIAFAKKLAKWGWFIAPFPFDLIVAPTVFAFVLYVSLFLPIIPVRIACKEKQKEEATVEVTKDVFNRR